MCSGYQLLKLEVVERIIGVRCVREDGFRRVEDFF